MTVSEKLDFIYSEKNKIKKIYDECGFSDTNLLSTYSENLSCIILSCGQYEQFINENWKGFLAFKYDGFDRVMEDENGVVNYVPEDATKIARAKIGSNCKNIKQSLRGCTNLSSVETTDSLTAIGEWGFQRCGNLLEINCRNAIYILQHAFDYCKSLSSISCDEVTIIQDQVFNNCHKLSSIHLPNIDIFYGSAIFVYTSQPLTIDMSNRTEKARKKRLIPMLQFTSPFGRSVAVSCIVPDDLLDKWRDNTNWSVAEENGKLILIPKSEYIS